MRQSSDLKRWVKNGLYNLKHAIDTNVVLENETFPKKVMNDVIKQNISYTVIFSLSKSHISSVHTTRRVTR